VALPVFQGIITAGATRDKGWARHADKPKKMELPDVSALSLDDALDDSMDKPTLLPTSSMSMFKRQKAGNSTANNTIANIEATRLPETPEKHVQSDTLKKKVSFSPAVTEIPRPPTPEGTLIRAWKSVKSVIGR
jgi:hypothetical protein